MFHKELKSAIYVQSDDPEEQEHTLILNDGESSHSFRDLKEMFHLINRLVLTSNTRLVLVGKGGKADNLDWDDIHPNIAFRRAIELRATGSWGEIVTEAEVADRNS